MKIETPHGARSTLLKLLGSATFILLVVMLVVSFRPESPSEILRESRLEKPSAVQHDSESLSVNLGGVPAQIPRHFAHNVEFDKEPNSTNGVDPQRVTQYSQATIKSFGFNVRYPDMAGESSNEIREDKKRYTIFNTPWISVGITTGSIYPGDGFLDRWTTTVLARKSDVIRYKNYEKLPGTEHGLTVYVPAGNDPVTKKPYRDSRFANDLFIYRDKDGYVATHIECSNVQIQSAPCTQTFSLAPEIKAEVYVSYRRGLLPEWEGIQRSVKSVLLGFRTTTTATVEVHAK